MNAPKSNTASLTFIFVTILVDVIGIGIIIPVIPKLIEGLTGQPLNEAAGWGGLLIMSFAAMQFLFSPLMGELSDRYGRRPILLISLAGLGVDYYFHAIAPTIWWLFAGRILAGICGASFTVATAYIADISSKENKAKNFGLIGAAFGVGFIIGPIIGGICAKWGVQVPFYVAAGFTILNFLFGLFLVPESLPKEKRRKINWAKTIPGVSLAHLNKYGSMLGLIIAFVLVHMAGQVMPSTWSFFTMELYGWDEAMVGYSLGVVGLLVGIVQGGLIGWATKKFGNRRVIMFGFLSWTLGMLLFSVAFSQAYLFVAIIPYVLGGVAGPTIQGVMSNQVPEDEQGNLQGALTSMISLTAVLGPILYTGLFYYYSGDKAQVYFPGAPYLLGGVFLVISSIVAFFALKKIKDIDATGGGQDTVGEKEITESDPIDDNEFEEDSSVEVV
ncbi:MAG: TCR/Tet family MFS transporter [Flavobacteriales bacterium]|nr:TCR/Tet family MFS transporter [Flavobacteriales bacterium]